MSVFSPEDDQAAAEKALEACCFYPTTPDLPLLMDDVMRAQEEEETIAFELAQRYARYVLTSTMMHSCLDVARL